MLRERLQKVIEFSAGEHSVDTYLKWVEEKRLHLFEIQGCLIGVEKFEYETKNVLNISLVEGEGFLNHIDEVKAVMSSLAKALDCSELTCYGRPGWARILRRHGATHVYTVMRLELSHEN